MSDFPEKENIEQETEEFSTVFSNPTEHKEAKNTKKKLLPKILAAVLAVAILAGGTVAVIKLIPEREEENSGPTIETVSLLKLDTDELKTVTVTNKNGTFKLYSRVTENSTSSSGATDTVNWYLEGYGEDVISSTTVSSIVGFAAELDAVRSVDKSEADCGLDTPNVEINIVKNDGSEISVLVGNKSPDNTGTYIKVSEKDKIYITESDIANDLTFDALSLAATETIAAVSTSDVESSYISDEKFSTFDTITLTGSRYPEKVVIAPNTDEKLSAYATYMTISPTKRIAQNVENLFPVFQNGISTSGAYSFETDATAKKTLGLDKPDVVAEIKAGNYKKAYHFKQQTDGDYAVWYEGAKLIWKVSASSIAFIDYSTTDYYAAWVALQSIDELSNLTIKLKDKTYSFDIKYDGTEGAEEPYVITYEGEKLVAENFQNFYQGLISVRCTDFNISSISAKPDMTVIFSFSEEGRESMSVEFKKQSETKYQYSIDGIDMGKINSTEYNKLVRNLEKVSKGEEVKAR